MITVIDAPGHCDFIVADIAVVAMHVGGGPLLNMPTVLWLASAGRRTARFVSRAFRLSCVALTSHYAYSQPICSMQQGHRILWTVAHSAWLRLLGRLEYSQGEWARPEFSSPSPPKPTMHNKTDKVRFITAFHYRFPALTLLVTRTTTTMFRPSRAPHTRPRSSSRRRTVYALVPSFRRIATCGRHRTRCKLRRRDSVTEAAASARALSLVRCFLEHTRIVCVH